MVGLYFHIPFCRRRCNYCDFYFVTNTALRTRFLESVVVELRTRAAEMNFAGERIETIYFGGGTPSMLEPSELSQLLDAAHHTFSVSPNAELTLEANPEDLTLDKLQAFAAAGINRLSLGVQSFSNTKLAQLSRQHTAEDAHRITDLARTCFSNISLDLIFGTEGETLEMWQRDVDAALSHQPEHLSCYSLTVEPQTPLAWMIRRGTRTPPIDKVQSEMFLAAMARLRSAGYNHYEVSNFGKKAFHSRHNSSYWNRTPYLGFGPSAHSFVVSGKATDGAVRKEEERFANAPSLSAYLASPAAAIAMRETLTDADIYNETVLLSLRQGAGLSMEFFEKCRTFVAPNFRTILQRFLQQDLIVIERGTLRLSDLGFTLADAIAEEFFA